MGNRASHRMRPLLVLAVVTLGSGVDSSAGIEQRIADRGVVERFYWSHREWPAHNPGPRPSFERSLPAHLLRRRAEDALRKSAALERFWGVRIGPRELARELERIARDTRDPERLQQLWHLLGDDPDRIAEAVARPLLADRLIRARYAWDRGLQRGPFDAWWQAVRETLTVAGVDPARGLALPDIAPRAQAVDTWVPMAPAGPLARSGHSAVWTGAEMIVWGGAEGSDLADGVRYDPATDSWSPVANLGAPAARTGHVAFWTGSAMLIWGGTRSVDGAYPGPGRRYDPASDTWQPMSEVGAPVDQAAPSAVWTGSTMIVWGGYDRAFGMPLGTGARYDAAADTWSPVSSAGAPSARAGHSAVWAGTRMIVWGGEDESGPVSTGARYNPVTDTWDATGQNGAPSGRTGHTATWDGTFMLVWGGTDLDGYAVAGARYRLQNNQWSAMTTEGAPVGREQHTAVWTGSRLVVWGGLNDNRYSDPGGRYDPAVDAWDGVTVSGAPNGRSAHTAVWTGTEVIVWGGQDEAGLLDTGGRYDPAIDGWQPVAEANGRPAARADHVIVWTGSELIAWGGGLSTPLDGGRYDPLTDSWTPTSEVGEPPDRIQAAAVWTGSEMVVWGGYGYDPGTGELRAVSSGGRYDPTTDSWSQSSPVGAPSPRGEHTAVWTGTEMIVWGGSDPLSGGVAGGGRYDPATDQWDTVTHVNEPSPRGYHTAVWTGSEMIVFGGQDGSVRVSGARYRPDLDLWRPTSEAGVMGRAQHSAAWTGSEMIVWGGVDGAGMQDGAGSRYDPLGNVWYTIPATSEPANPQNSKAIWACGSLVAWGPNATETAAAGARYEPSTGLWQPMSSLGAPLAVYGLSLAPNDTSALLFGGVGPLGSATATGGIYRACDTPPGLDSISGLSMAPGAAGSRLAWHSAPTATGYDVVRGDLLTLRSTAGDFTAATQACLLSNAAQSWVEDPLTPAPGAAWWYLARTRRGAEVGSYDSGGIGQSGSRDAGILASGHDCP